MPKKPSTLTRRDFTSGLLASLALPSILQAHALTVNGVRLGVQSYSFHTFKVGGEPAIGEICAALKRLRVNLIELFCPQIEPFSTPSWSWKQWDHSAGAGPTTKNSGDTKQERTRLREWRIHTPDSYFTGTRTKFAANGVQIYCYNYSFEPDMTDEEIDAGFRQAHLLGATYITSSSTVSTAHRVVPFAEKKKTCVGWHNHADLKDPDAICKPETLGKLLAMSPFYGINLDIGHFTTAGFDPVAFIDKEHASITNLHIKDRLKNQGENRSFGEGDTNIAGVLHLLRDKHYDIPAFVEYEYLGQQSPEKEIAKSLQYEEKILRS